jgi:predicted DNA-binding transcriptional regulator AlpA
MQIEQRNLIPSSAVKARIGGVSDMTLYRWLRKPELGFPQPVVIQKRRYWDVAEIEAFITTKRMRAA